MWADGGSPFDVPCRPEVDALSASGGVEDATLSVSNVSVTFGGHQVLYGVSLDLREGEVHGLVGSNGAGKSTLIRVIAGEHRPDAGARIVVDGRAVETGYGPRKAGQLGVTFVHQDAPLIGSLSLAESVALQTQYPTGAGGRVRWDKVREHAAELLERWQLPLSPDMPVRDLTASDRTLLSVGIALDDRDGVPVRVLIVDEPTASLSSRDAQVVLDAVARIANAGVSVLLVTHRLGELLTYTTTVTVLRDGRVVHRGGSANLTAGQLTRHMVGHSAGEAEQTEGDEYATGLGRLWSLSSVSRTTPSGTSPVVRADQLSGGALEAVSFDIKAGEIVGFVGLSGSGVEHLPAILSGVQRRDGGTVQIAGTHLPAKAKPSDARRLGIALVPGDRVLEGGVATLDLQENILLPLPTRAWRGRISGRLLGEVISMFAIVPPDRRANFAAFSGGNQQKAVVGKAMALAPRALVLVQPSAGVDTVTRRTVHQVVLAAAKLGVAVLLFSSELEEVAALADRVLFVRAGRITGSATSAEDLTVEALSEALHAKGLAA
jgi:ribose transport system ATP-binding protein